jgi:hypothetical protein
MVSDCSNIGMLHLSHTRHSAVPFQVIHATARLSLHCYRISEIDSSDANVYSQLVRESDNIIVTNKSLHSMSEFAISRHRLVSGYLISDGRRSQWRIKVYCFVLCISNCLYDSGTKIIFKKKGFQNCLLGGWLTGRRALLLG